VKDRRCEGCPLQYQKIVPPAGPLNANILLIGEAPGENEERDGVPFVGGAGRILNGLLRTANIDRGTCRIDNVLQCRPPNNSMKTNEARQALEHCIPRFLSRLHQVHPMVTVPMGNTALNALGFYYPISKARGAVMRSPHGRIIPTWHPAYIMRQWHEYLTAQYDWKKIKRHSEGYLGQIEPPEFFHIKPNIIDVEMFEKQVSEQALRGEVVLGIDLETYEIDNPQNIPIKVCGIATNERTVMVIPFITESGNYYWGTHDEAIRAIMAIGRILENPRIVKMFHNALFDVQVLMNHGWHVVPPIFDTMIAQFLICHLLPQSLAYLVSIHTDYPPWKLEKVKGDIGIRTYNARDCAVLHLIRDNILRDLEDNNLTYLFYREMDNIIPTVKMMLNGLRISPERHGAVNDQLEADIRRMTESLQDLSGRPDLNPNSSPQLAGVLFDDLGLRSQVKTKGGKRSTKEDVLNRLSKRYPDQPFVAKLLEYRNVQKLKSTFADPPILADGRVHSQFKRNVVTGRFSSSNPNVQNLPSGRRGEKGESQKYIRRMYVPDPGHVFVATDISQAELYVFAVVTQDEAWLSAFAEGKDIHEMNCGDMMGFYEAKYRTFIKNVIYGVIFGSEGPEIEKVAPKELIGKISVQQMLENLWKTHPSVKAFRDYQSSIIANGGKVRTPFGRIRYFVGSPTKAQIRQGVNHPIQGTIGDIMVEKMAMVDQVLAWPTDRLVLQLHDSLYVETPEARKDIVARKMKRVMELPISSPDGLEFRFKIDVKIGTSLLEDEMGKWDGVA